MAFRGAGGEVGWVIQPLGGAWTMAQWLESFASRAGHVRVSPFQSTLSTKSSRGLRLGTLQFFGIRRIREILSL
ncbi:hypothetical protein SBA4_3570013 [Candidatus Sulfopaludibacter sp. SbA4]|nr:hypothetical protein SBA4_3570013 [Candidatus Sulfopaludibacter sp. SbA4]